MSNDDQRPLPGNGYAYGQIAHLIAWIYAVLGAGKKTGEEIATPMKVYCNMSHAPKTGADISFAAVITCPNGMTFSLSGTALLPGSQYADPTIGKHIRIELYGEAGTLESITHVRNAAMHVVPLIPFFNHTYSTCIVTMNDSNYYDKDR